MKKMAVFCSDVREYLYHCQLRKYSEGDDYDIMPVCEECRAVFAAAGIVVLFKHCLYHKECLEKRLTLAAREESLKKQGKIGQANQVIPLTVVKIGDEDLKKVPYDKYLLRNLFEYLSEVD